MPTYDEAKQMHESATEIQRQQNWEQIKKELRKERQKKLSVNDESKQLYRGDLNFHPRPLTYSFILMNDTEVIALQAPIEYTMNDNAELQNGRWAMIGIMAALGAYATTGQIIPGIF